MPIPKPKYPKGKKSGTNKWYYTEGAELTDLEVRVWVLDLDEGECFSDPDVEEGVEIVDYENTFICMISIDSNFETYEP